MRFVQVDKIGSATVNLGLPRTVPITTRYEPRIGNVVVVRVISESLTYNQLELPSGRLCTINRNDVVVGVLGERRALKGFVGEVPAQLQPGDWLHILNLGGVMGRCIDHSNDLGKAVQVELLGMVVDSDGNGQAEPAILNIAKKAIPPVDHLDHSCPLILVAGTCMNSGKTFAATQLIKHFTQGGYRVAAAKLTGIACLRDTLNMQDHGAIMTLSFLDCGYPSTVSTPNLAGVAKAIITRLNEAEPDLILLELGDGIIGGYNVQSVLADKELMGFVGVVVFCASDFVGAWGGLQLLKQKGLEIDVFSGPVTDSLMGREFINRELGILAANALNDSETLFELVAGRLQERQKRF